MYYQYDWGDDSALLGFIGGLCCCCHPCLVFGAAVCAAVRRMMSMPATRRRGDRPGDFPAGWHFSGCWRLLGPDRSACTAGAWLRTLARWLDGWQQTARCAWDPTCDPDQIRQECRQAIGRCHGTYQQTHATPWGFPNNTLLSHICISLSTFFDGAGAGCQAVVTQPRIQRSMKTLAML